MDTTSTVFVTVQDVHPKLSFHTIVMDRVSVTGVTDWVSVTDWVFGTAAAHS